VPHRAVKKRLHPADLIPSLRRGVRVFHTEVTVDPKAPSVITSDAQDDDVYGAILEDGVIEIEAAEPNNGGSILWSFRAHRHAAR
jgi:hypothetical protein